MNSKIEELHLIHGQPSERALKKVLDYISEPVREFIEKSPFAVMASSNSMGDCDASPRGGLPGFIKVMDSKTLLIPDIKGNRLFHSYQNVETNAKVGLLFMIPGRKDTVRVNGSVRILDKQEVDALIEKMEVNSPDDNSILIQGLLLSVDEAYTHCPRALQFSDLWNTQTIEANQEELNRR